MLSGGKLYVPGAEKRIPNMRRLLHSAASTGIFVISSTDQHAPNDPEFARFPPHCVKGTSDRKSTRLNSSHPSISYAVFCLKKKKRNQLLSLRSSLHPLTS